MLPPTPPVRRFKLPTHTQIPNELIDELMPDLTGAEFKILTYLCRRTFGFHRDSDAVPLSQLTGGLSIGGQAVDKGTGLSERTCCSAIKSLEDKNLIWVGRFRDPMTGDVANRYAVLMEWPEVKENPEDPRLQKFQTGATAKISDPRLQKLQTPYKERNKEKRNKGLGPNGPVEKSVPAEPCPIGNCDGTGIVSGPCTLEGVKAGRTVICDCPAGRQKMDWVDQMLD